MCVYIYAKYTCSNNMKEWQSLVNVTFMDIFIKTMVCPVNPFHLLHKSQMPYIYKAALHIQNKT